MNEDWKRWEACEWLCHCGHRLNVTLQEIEKHGAEEIAKFRLRCNNCPEVRFLTLTEPQ